MQLAIPIEPEECLELAWSLMFLFSDNEANRKIGQDIQERLNKFVESQTDPYVKLYLFHMSNAIYATTRIVSYRATGMRNYVDLFNNIEKAKIDELNNLATITSKPASLVPRVISGITGGALGSVSLPAILEKAANSVIPSIGTLTGYELFIIFIIFGSSIGYTAIEFLLRLYRMYALPRILNETQTEKSVAWNRYIRESREAMRNLLIDAIKIREKFFPALRTYNKKNFFSDLNSIRRDENDAFNSILTSVIRARGPQVRNFLSIKPKAIPNSSRRGIWKFSISKGDIISGSFASQLDERINFYYYEITNENLDPRIDQAAYTRKMVFADEFSFASKTDGWGVLYFENTSFLRSRSISFSCEIIRYNINKFCIDGLDHTNKQDFFLSAADQNLFQKKLTPPKFTYIPMDITVKNGDKAGSIVNYQQPDAIDNNGDNVIAFCSPPSGSMFPIGKTQVKCIAIDKFGNSTTIGFNINVED